MTTTSALNQFNRAEEPARALLERLGWPYVPREALAVLRDALALGSREGQVFPAKEGGAMSDMVFTALLRRLKVGCVPHGFRSSFRDWCAETGVPRDLAESALSHSLGGAVKTAYQRSDLAEQRRELMQRWGDYCRG